MCVALDSQMPLAYAKLECCKVNELQLTSVCVCVCVCVCVVFFVMRAIGFVLVYKLTKSGERCKTALVH
jgi:hypothetical protein